MLQLPEKLDKEFKLLCNVEPNSVTRSLTDMAGNTGATWVATDKDRLIMFERQPDSGEFSMHPYRYADASAFSLDDDGKFAFMQITFPDREVTLKFSSMEISTLTKIHAQWKPVTDQTDVSAPTEMTPMLIFLAALQALIQADQDLASEEVGWIQDNMIDTNALRRAGAWLRENGVSQLLALINDRFDKVQKRCLHGNLISLAMSDGEYRGTEAELIEKIRDGIGISEKAHQSMFDMQEALHDTALFYSTDAGLASPEAANLFCACLLAMAECDGTKRRKEGRMVKKLFKQRETINSARTYLEQLGIKGIIDYLPGPLTDPQKRCILLNQLQIAVADGVFNSHKQDLLDRFRRALKMNEESYQKDLNRFIILQNLSVFAFTSEEGTRGEAKPETSESTT